jgi:putative FmdB family regulatory protein
VIGEGEEGMPTYDYRCNACGHTFEEFQSFSEEPLRKCPQCKKNKLQRLFGTGAGVIFKGSGFYETDYRSDSYKQAAKAEQASKSDSSAKTDTAAPSGNGDTNGAVAPAKGKPSGKSSKSAT